APGLPDTAGERGHQPVPADVPLDVAVVEYQVPGQSVGVLRLNGDLVHTEFIDLPTGPGSLDIVAGKVMDERQVQRRRKDDLPRHLRAALPGRVQAPLRE